jgi:SAM-dependent methyltransferase
VTAPNVDGLSIDELRDSRASWWTAEFDDFLWPSLAAVVPAGILDVGCGIGTFARHLAPRCPPGTVLVGVDVDLGRLDVARREASGQAASGASYCAADGRRLPFAGATFGATATILTLQHLADPVEVLGEMRRVTRPGGVVMAVEADNLGQRLYFPAPAPGVDAALQAFWRRMQESPQAPDLAVGPRLPALFHAAGLPSPRISGYLVANATWADPGLFVKRARTAFQRIAGMHGLDGCRECGTLADAIQQAVENAPEPFYTIATVPLFLAVARM